MADWLMGFALAAGVILLAVIRKDVLRYLYPKEKSKPKRPVSSWQLEWVSPDWDRSSYYPGLPENRRRWEECPLEPR